MKEWLPWWDMKFGFQVTGLTDLLAFAVSLNFLSPRVLFLKRREKHRFGGARSFLGIVSTSIWLFLFFLEI